MKQVFNPYLPLYEYIADGEPHVFDGRIYVYGSHDHAGSGIYSPGDYVTWSAALEDLSDWRYEGVIYRKNQDPSNADGRHQLWAPDVCRGADGRYYLYYCLSLIPEIGVAVSDSPKGPFEFYGHVKYPAHIMGGKELNEHRPFDPAVFVDEDARIYLYYGSSPVHIPDRKELEERGMDKEQIDLHLARIERLGRGPGAMVTELEKDMLTVKTEPKMIVPGGLLEEGTGFEGHGFFEAASMRKINEKYYFIYSSRLSHELCYAVSELPDGNFCYGGTILSNGDIGYGGNKNPKNMMGNNHGSLVCIGEQWYVFYHRHTHATESSRQGCAEPIAILPDGKILQAEMTSCGLNGGPLQGRGTYPAVISCNLMCGAEMKKLDYGQSKKEEMPYVYEEYCGGREQEHIHYIANICDEVTVGYKYFSCCCIEALTVEVRGRCRGKISVLIKERREGAAMEAVEKMKTAENEMPVGELFMELSGESWEKRKIPVHMADGVYDIFLRYHGEGSFCLKELGFVEKKFN